MGRRRIDRALGVRRRIIVCIRGDSQKPSKARYFRNALWTTCMAATFDNYEFSVSRNGATFALILLSTRFDQDQGAGWFPMRRVVSEMDQWKRGNYWGPLRHLTPHDAEKIFPEEKSFPSPCYPSSCSRISPWWCISDYAGWYQTVLANRPSG